MSYNRSDGGKAIVTIAAAQVGKPYSEQSPAGSDGDGHYWLPGEPWPSAFDCSGLTHTSCLAVGISISQGNADEQWKEHVGGVVPDSDPLLPGDIGAFLGVDNTPGYAGHTGIVVAYSTLHHSGILVNAYDTRRGVCYVPFERGQSANANNGLGVLGFYRPANSLPALIAVPSAVELVDAQLIGISRALIPKAVVGGWPVYVWSKAKGFYEAEPAIVGPRYVSIFFNQG